VKVFKSVVLTGKNLFLTTAIDEVSVLERKRKMGTEGSIWSESFQFKAGKQGEWIEDGKFLRAGVSVVVLVPDIKQFKVILNRFDSGHPTAAGKLSTPAGVWEGKKSLLDAALKELGEEVILVDSFGLVFWAFDNRFLSKDWAEKYARENGIEKFNDAKIKIEPFESPETIAIYLDGVYQGQAILAYESENGGIEIMFLFMTKETINGFILKDGENFDGQWLNREVGFFSLDDLSKESEKTTKVDVVEKLLKSF